MNAETKIEAPPETVNAAVVAVMADIKRIEKGERNSHGNYNFAGIDSFLDLVRPLCAEHGLVIYQEEEACEIVDTVTAKGASSKALWMRFAFTLECGSDIKGPFHRTIMVPATMGSQAFGAGQSYALKQFERALFQISTGEKDDIDHHDTGELAARAPVLVGDADVTEIIQLCEALGGNQSGLICDAYKVSSIPELTAVQGQAVITRLKGKLADAAKAETNAKAVEVENA